MKNIKRFFVVLILGLTASSFAEDIRIAYVGASYWTAGGGLSVIFPEMLRARGWKVDNEGLIGSLQNIVTEYGQEETEIPGYILRTQQKAAKILDDDEGLDYLFVMGHSSNPFDSRVDLDARVKTLLERVRATHPDTEIVLASTWARPDDTGKWNVVHDLYTEIGENQGLPIVSFAALWHEIEELDNEVTLYRTEQHGRLNHHNGYPGSYANGCLLYALMSGKKFISAEDDFASKKFHPQKIKPNERPWDLTTEEKAFLEDAAWASYQKHIKE